MKHYLVNYVITGDNVVDKHTTTITMKEDFFDFVYFSDCVGTTNFQINFMKELSEDEADSFSKFYKRNYNENRKTNKTND